MNKLQCPHACANSRMAAPGIPTLVLSGYSASAIDDILRTRAADAGVTVVLPAIQEAELRTAQAVSAWAPGDAAGAWEVPAPVLSAGSPRALVSERAEQRGTGARRRTKKRRAARAPGNPAALDKLAVLRAQRDARAARAVARARARDNL